MSMREIKFRGERQKDKSWIYGYLIKDTYGHCRIQFDAKQFSQVIIPETVGQFTGLRDKNGVKIYEGDILKIKETPFQIGGLHQVIFYEDRYLTYSILYNDIDQANKHPLLYQIEYADAHVIGNIYDNPELLNK